MPVAKSPAVGAWVPITLHRVASGFVLAGSVVVAAMVRIPIIVWQNTTSASLQLSMSEAYGLDI